MKPELVIYFVALAAATMAWVNPARKHEKRTDELNDDSDNHLRYTVEEFQSGNAAWTTNTNLVGIRIVLNRINSALWLIVALLIIIAAPQIVRLVSL
ncbi:hypothetical protein [Rhizobium mongolense]|uniref:hypothetical protein n=1 Tax=Rhizobium mongolense TaxID=57676 RepID=UPI0034A3E15D